MLRKPSIDAICACYVGMPSNCDHVLAILIRVDFNTQPVQETLRLFTQLQWTISIFFVAKNKPQNKTSYLKQLSAEYICHDGSACAKISFHVAATIALIFMALLTICNHISYSMVAANDVILLDQHLKMSSQENLSIQEQGYYQWQTGKRFKKPRNLIHNAKIYN